LEVVFFEVLEGEVFYGLFDEDSSASMSCGVRVVSIINSVLWDFEVAFCSEVGFTDE
jgi:hypothetical protein